MDTRNRFGGRLSVTNSSSEMKPITAGAGSPYVNAPDNHDARGPSAEPFGTTSSDGGGSSTGDEEDELFDENGMLKPLPIGGPIFSILALCALVLFAVGASLPWMSRRLPDISYFFTLWKFTTKSPEGFPVDNWVIDMACMQMKARLRVLEVFAVLTIGFTAMAVPIGIASSRQRKPLLPGIIVIGMAAIFALATWAMSIALYFKSNMCPNDVDTNPLSFSAQKFDFDAGFGLYVTGNVLLLLAMAVGILQPVVPPSIRRSAVVRLMTIIAAVVHIVCALFVIVGTAPVQWFYKWDSDLATVHRITLWSNRTSTNGNEINNDRLVDSQCGEISALARFGQAFACAAIPVTILGAILSVLSSDLFTPGGVGSRFIGLRGCIFAMMGTVVTTVCPLVAGLSLYYRQFCAIPSLQGDQYHMTGGLVLVGCATALSAFGLIVLLTVAIVQIVAKPNSAEASLGNTRWTAFLFLVCVGICVLFQAIAANSYLFGKTRDDFNWEQWSFWRVYHRQSAISYNTAFSCPDQRRRLIGAGVLNIIGLVVNAAAFLLGIAQLSSRFLRRAASMVGLSGCLLLLVSWSIVVDVYRTGYCGQASFASQGFKLIEGFGLQIVGWGIAVMACVLNYLLVPFKVNRP